MKIAVDIGHNTAYDGGAVGILSENKCAMEVGTALMEKLTKAGHTVIDCLPRGSVKSLGDSLKQRTDKANSQGADIYVCVHFNAGKGQGTMVLYKSDKGKALGEPILKEVVNAIGTKNLGMSLRTDLYVLNQSNMPACLVECLFVDTQSDVDKYNANKIAEGIFKGITGTNSATSTPTPGAGAQSIDIKNLQMSLNAMGFTDSQGNKLDVDGVLGEKTRSAAQKFDEVLHKSILK